MMKRILLITAMLWSVAYGQSKGYLRYDSVYIQKIGGNGELIIENGTRNVTGGVLTNMGNGRTRFVIPSGGGGDSLGVQDTLFNASRYVNMDGSEFSFNDGTVIHGGDKRAVGTRMLKTFNSTTPVFTASLPSASVSYTTSGMIIDGGNNTLSNFLETPDSVGLFSSHEMTTSFDFIGTEYDNQSLGFIIGFVAQGNGQSVLTLLRLTDTAAYIQTNLSASMPGGTNTSSKDYYAFKRAAGDTMHADIIRNSYGYFVKVYNKANGSSMQISIEQIQTSNCKIRIYPLGGEWKFLNFRVTYNDIANSMLIFLGDSIMTALTGESENSRTMSQVATGMDGGYVDFSGAAEQSIDGYRRIAEVIRFFNPAEATIIWGYVVNDRNGSVNIDSFAARTRRSFDALIAAGFRIVAVNGTPQSGGSIVPYNDTLAFICAQRGIMLINKYALLVASSGTAMDAKYDYGDGIHENQLAMDVVAAYLRQKLLDSGYIRLGGPVKNFPKPIASKFYYYNVTLADGTEAKAVAGTEAGYLHLVSADNDATVFQGGPGKKRNFNLHGDGWMTSFRWGTSPQTGAMKLDQTGIDATAIRASSSLLVGPAAGANRFEVTTDITVATKDIDLFNDSRISGNSQPVYLERFIPQNGGKVGLLHVTSTTGGGVIQSDYRHFAYMSDADTVVFADDNGSIYSKGVHQYLADSSSTILAHDRRIPDVGAVKTLISTLSPALTDGDKGDITVSSTGTVWTIDNDVVTYAKMQNVSATSRLLGRITAGAGDAEELTGTQATTLLDVFTSGLKGLAPASGGGTTNFLRADGTWAAPGGGGGGSPGGNTTEVQYNNAGAFGGITGATSNGTTLTITSGRATTDFSPTTNDGAALGTTALQFSDLHLATGAVINYNNGNYTFTHSTGLVTASGGFTANGTIISGVNINLNGAASSFGVNNRANPTAIIMQIYGNDANTVNLFGNGSDRWTFKLSNGNFGIGTTNPTGSIHLKAETSTASSEPIRFTVPSNLVATPVSQALGVNTAGTKMYYVNASATRLNVITDAGTALTSGRIPFADADGYLTDNAAISVSSNALKIGASGAPIASILSGTGVLDFPSTAAASFNDLTVTVTGAAVGDAVFISVPNGSVVNNGSYSAWVSATNTVTIRFTNNDASSSGDPASGTFRAAVFVF